MSTDSDTTLESTTSKVSRLDAKVGSLSNDVVRLNESLKDFSRNTKNDIDRLGNDLTQQLRGLQNDFINSRKPDWALFIAAAGLLVVLVGSIGGMAVVPLYLSANYANGEAARARDWQDAYMKGQIPSSATGQINELKADFVGKIDALSAKLIGITAEMETQIQHRKEISLASTQEVKEIKDEITRLREQQGRVKEKLGMP